MGKIYALKSPEISEMERKHLNFVRSKAGECMVLLKNDGVLPFRNPRKVALYGNGARETVKGGTGSGDVNSRFAVSIEQGLEESGFVITTKKWLDMQSAFASEERREFRRKVEEKAATKGADPMLLSLLEHFIPRRLAPLDEKLIEESDTDTAIYVLSRNSGEGTDRVNTEGDYKISDEEMTQLRMLGTYYSKVILLLNVGGVMELAPVHCLPQIRTIVLMGQCGNIGGYAVADVLLGKTIPSGRLTDTWAMHYEDYPSSKGFSHNNGNCNDEYYTEGIYVGYRYFDTFGVEPLYPFGYGLDYTTFSIDTKTVEVIGDRVYVTVEVTNSGEIYSGREVVQIYASAPPGRLEKPYQELVGFGKTKVLAPGERQTLRIFFLLTNMESYNPELAAYILESGYYTLRVGKHSRNNKVVARLLLKDNVITKKVHNICRNREEFPELRSGRKAKSGCQEEMLQKDQGLTLEINTEQIKMETVSYSRMPQPLPFPDVDHVITMQDVKRGDYTVEELVAQLKIQEMADLCVGIARDEESVIGMGAKSVPGAAGDTSVLLNKSRDVRSMVNADGPAGLRLTPHFRTDAKGNVLPGGETFGDMKKEMPDKKEGEIDYYQYCTAIPIASLLASSWDMELLFDMGDLVGSEMERFGVRVWLAPGMNIHRNPLCGRNFEYFSEDPLLSGMCAAAEVKGIQKHAGIGACVKHFCANNQEDNRMFLNVHIRERALREIYLRNFGIAIQSSQPMTIMTSYNLINGIHAANNYDLITSYARDENGFKGYVMTDWYTSNSKVAKSMSSEDVRYGVSSSPLCISAGNDLQMPGSEENVFDIIEAVGKGTLPLELLQQCCIRILRTALKCACYEDSKPYMHGMVLKEFCGFAPESLI